MGFGVVVVAKADADVASAPAAGPIDSAIIGAAVAYLQQPERYAAAKSPDFRWGPESQKTSAAAIVTGAVAIDWFAVESFDGVGGEKDVVVVVVVVVVVGMKLPRW